MLENLIRWSIHHRLVVLLIALASVGLGSYVAVRLPVDVFPELSAPTVTLLTEAHSMAPEEVEILVTFPIETALNGAPGVRRVRSVSGIGISVVWVEFDWGTDIYKARQIVSEKLQLVANGLPPGIQSPVMAPISSVMGEIILIGLTGPAEKLMELRTLADWVVRRHLLAVSGVSQVVPIGGQVRQFQVQLDSEEMRHRGVSLNEVLRAVETSSVNSAGGFFTESGKEFLVRGVGRVTKIQELGETPIKTREGVPVVLAQVGEVRIGAKVRRGTASVDAQEAVILSVQKQPQANTLELTGRIDEVLTEIEVGLPSGIGIERNIFRQSDFIETAIANVIEALRDGAILVVAVLFLFLMNFRTTLVSALAIPLSLIVTLLVLWLWGTSINTMTLGGMAIAVGALVDDAIIDVENVFRRLRQNRERPPEGRLSPVQIIFEACTEVRYPILFATFIVTVVFVPLFALSGLEGRMLIPLGVSYIVSIFASLLVALTVTPALCTYLLSNSTYGGNVDSWIVRRLKASYAPALRFSIEHQYGVMGLCAGLVLATLLLIPQMGRSFLPEFNEGTLTINMVTLPGTALERFDELGRLAEEIILSNPEITSTSRRTGRAELDEHAQEVNAAEIDVRFQLKDRSREVFLASLRNQLLAIPGTNFNIGQPISHRLDHMLSGTRAAIAIKLFGPDLLRLRAFGEQIRAAVESVAGVVDLQVEQQAHVPQVQLHYDRKAIGRSGLTISDVSLVVDAGLNGAVVGQIVEDQRAFDLLVRFNEKSRSSLAQIQQATIPNGGTAVVPLKQLADIRVDAGPNRHCHVNRVGPQRPAWIPFQAAALALSHTLNASFRNRLNVNLLRKCRWT